MQRPRIALDNYHRVYDYYREFDPPQTPMRIAYAAFARAVDPLIEFAGNAEFDLERVNKNSNPHIYAINHQHPMDQVVLGAALHRIDPDNVGRLRTLGSDVSVRRLSHIGNIIGAIPVYRKEDHYDEDIVREASYPVLFDCVAHRMESGEKLIQYVEGAFNKTSPDTITGVRTGIAEIALRTTSVDLPTAITPIGIGYRNKKPSITNSIHANVFVGRTLFIAPNQSVGHIVRQTRTALQHAVSSANATY